MITDMFAFLEDVTIILLILVGMVLLLFGLRLLLPGGGGCDCDDTHNAAFRREIRSSRRVLGAHNLFRRFFDVKVKGSHASSGSHPHNGHAADASAISKSNPH